MVIILQRIQVLNAVQLKLMLYVNYISIKMNKKLKNSSNYIILKNKNWLVAIL